MIGNKYKPESPTQEFVRPALDALTGGGERQTAIELDRWQSDLQRSLSPHSTQGRLIWLYGNATVGVWNYEGRVRRREYEWLLGTCDLQLMR